MYAKSTYACIIFVFDLKSVDLYVVTFKWNLLILFLRNCSDLWTALHCWGFRKMEEQKPKEQRPKASENKPIMTEWYLLGLLCLKWGRIVDVLAAMVSVGGYLIKPCCDYLSQPTVTDFTFEFIMVSVWTWMLLSLFSNAIAFLWKKTSHLFMHVALVLLVVLFP